MYVTSKSYSSIFVRIHMQVAARVKMDDGEEQWIMAVVVKYDSHHHKYTVDDFDEDGKESGYVYSAPSEP